MTLEDFYREIKAEIGRIFASTTDTPKKLQNFLLLLNQIFTDLVVDNDLKVTRMTILLEGFYRSLDSKSELKKNFLLLRMFRWSARKC